MDQVRTVSGVLSIIVAPLCLVVGGLLIRIGLQPVAPWLFLLALVVFGTSLLVRGSNK